MMQKKGLSVVFTNDNCIGCNRCISGCPIPGANIAQVKKGKNRIIVDSSKCIHCGHCISTCRHSAREYIDDTDSFFDDLQKGIPISLAVAPSFYIDYAEEAPKILGYLQHLGIQKIYNVSYGADIATWAHIHYLKDHPKSSGITAPCAAIVNYLEKSNPFLLEKLIPIKSPLLCLATYVRKYLGEKNRIAFISPCIAKKDEIDSSEAHDLVQYNVTFRHLFAKLANIPLDTYNATADIGNFGLGAIYPLPGGMKQNIELFIDDSRPVLRMADAIKFYPRLSDSNNIFSDSQNPLLIEPLHCEFGCLLGTGVPTEDSQLSSVVSQFSRIHKFNSAIDAQKDNPFARSISPQQRLHLLDRHFAGIDSADFYRAFHENYEQQFDIPEDIYEEIFTSMHKKTADSRHIDCQACGYKSCRQMVEAIAGGYNSITNCIQYEKDENMRLYTVDHLTGLPNKYVFMQTLETMIANNTTEGFSVIQFNVKNFMLVNNSFGFAHGSTILAEFAHAVRDTMMPDDFLFHSGGDSFMALIQRQRVNSFVFMINRIELPSLQNAASEMRILNVRCGVYHMASNEQSPEIILNRVASAYLVTKRRGNTDIAFYDQSISLTIMNSMVISQQIPNALKNEEFFVVYQPKVRLGDQVLIGAEALIRWRRNGKIISPDNFVPICESNGFVKRLDFFVLNHVCRKQSEWLAAGLEPVRISVNFSKLHFSQPDIAERICNIIDDWQIPRELIEIEFTETSYSEMQDSFQRTISLLKQNGISSSIDDFGTGYSSLSLLQNLDFDVLKLDKSLINTMLPNSRAKKVVTNIVRMAKDLKMDVVAEGVESKDELTMLGSLNCDIIQGFIFDKPLPEASFESRLRNKHYIN